MDVELLCPELVRVTFIPEEDEFEEEVAASRVGFWLETIVEVEGNKVTTGVAISRWKMLSASAQQSLLPVPAAQHHSRTSLPQYSMTSALLVFAATISA